MSMQTTMNWNAGAQAARQSETTTRRERGAQAVASIRRLRQEYIEQRLRMAHNAYNAHHLYLELAARAKSPDCKALYQRLAETEQRHLFRHTMRLKKLGCTAPKFRRLWLTKVWQRLLVNCAPRWIHKRLENMRRGETRRQIELIRRQSDVAHTKLAASD